MSNCFQLRSKVSGESRKLTEIDEELCHHFGAPVHPTRWYEGWYDYIGFCLACGKSFEQIAEIFKDDAALVAITEYLAKHYTAEAWAEIGASVRDCA